MESLDLFPVAETTPMSSTDYDELYQTIHENFSSNITVNQITYSSSNMERNEDLAKVEVAVLTFLFLLALTGNSIILIGIFLGKQKMSRMYYFILHLSLADLTTAFFNILPQLCWELTHRFLGGNFLCKVVKYSQILGPYSSSYILVVTAIDRYQAICYPLRNSVWTSKYSKIMLSFAWIISFLFCIPQTIIFSYKKVSDDPPEYDCWATFPENWGAKLYVTWYSVTVFIIPLLILIFTYGCISRAIWLNFGLQIPSIIAEHNNIDNCCSGGTNNFELINIKQDLSPCVESEDLVDHEKVKPHAVVYGAFVRPYFSNDSQKQELHSNSDLSSKQNIISVLKDIRKNRADGECSNKHLTDRFISYNGTNINSSFSDAVKHSEFFNEPGMCTPNGNTSVTFINGERISVQILSSKIHVPASKSADFTKQLINREGLLKRCKTIASVNHKRYHATVTCTDTKGYEYHAIKEKKLVFSNNMHTKTSGKFSKSRLTSTQSCMPKSTDLNGQTTRSNGIISRAKIKTIKLTLTIICCYIVCSLPFIAAQLWSVYDPEAHTSPFFTGPIFTILTLLASLNSCANPYIFLFFNPNLIRNCSQRWSRWRLKNIHHKTPRALTPRRKLYPSNDL